MKTSACRSSAAAAGPTTATCGRWPPGWPRLPERGPSVVLRRGSLSVSLDGTDDDGRAAESHDLDLRISLEWGGGRVLGDRPPELAVHEDHAAGTARCGPAHDAYLADHALPAGAHPPPARPEDVEHRPDGREQHQDRRYHQGVERDPEAFLEGRGSLDQRRAREIERDPLRLDPLSVRRVEDRFEVGLDVLDHANVEGLLGAGGGRLPDGIFGPLFVASVRLREPPDEGGGVVGDLLA